MNTLRPRPLMSRRSALTAAALIATHRPDALISTGCAGGLAPEPGVMGVVAAASTVYHDVWCGEGNAYGQVQGLPARFEADTRLLDVARALAADPTVSTPVCCGLTCTGDKFITDPDELSAVCRAFPEALAVDMESAAIAHTCYLHRVPFLSFRVISDTPGAESHWEQYQDFWGTMADRSFGITRTFLSRIPATF